MTDSKYSIREDVSRGPARQPCGLQQAMVHPHDLLLPRHVPVHSLEYLGRIYQSGIISNFMKKYVKF